MSYEIWKDVPDFPGYQVSNHGRARSSSRLMAITKDGPYYYVSLRRDGKYKKIGIHRLVLLAFVGPPPFLGAWALHKDDNPANNHLDNLYYGTAVDNAADCIRNGHRWDNKGSNHPLSKITEEDIPKIAVLLREGKTDTEISEIFGVGRKVIERVRKKKGWTHVDIGDVPYRYPPETRSKASRNAKLRYDNRSGYKRVTWNEENKKWFATIIIAGKRKYLGMFADPCEAAKAVNDGYRKFLPGVELPNKEDEEKCQ